MHQPHQGSIAVVRRLNAPCSRVYAACTEPALLARWLVPGAGEVRHAISEAEVGGRLCLEGIDPNGDRYCISGRFMTIEPERRIVLNWHYEGAVEAMRGTPSQVTLYLRVLAPDLKELTVTHAQLDTGETADIYATIWGLCLDRFASIAAAPEQAEPARFHGAVLTDLYGDSHRELQADFDTQKLANAVRENTLTTEIIDDYKAFIESRELFFLTTIDHRGFPTCSHKGGDPGFVQVVDERTLVFPSYNGNGMFLSTGNIAARPKIGMLFVDFETPNRLRIHGTAKLCRNDPRMARFVGAELLVEVRVAELFVNCPRYIHRYKRIERSKYVPKQGHTPPLPAWKRIDALQHAMPESDRRRVDKTLSLEAYMDKLGKGQA